MPDSWKSFYTRSVCNTGNTLYTTVIYLAVRDIIAWYYTCFRIKPPRFKRTRARAGGWWRWEIGIWVRVAGGCRTCGHFTVINPLEWSIHIYIYDYNILSPCLTRQCLFWTWPERKVLSFCDCKLTPRQLFKSVFKEAKKKPFHNVLNSARRKQEVIVAVLPAVYNIMCYFTIPVWYNGFKLVLTCNTFLWRSTYQKTTRKTVTKIAT